ncbi:MAG: hypothetical protein MK180_06845 [Rhodobacteraceae bacterium]|nr:hypothetical protein [Paracoccaceae bacterium]
MTLEYFRAPDTLQALMLVEERLGSDALIHAIDSDGPSVIVKATAASVPAPVPDAPRKPPSPMRPSFLDPDRPKPFEEPGADQWIDAPAASPAFAERSHVSASAARDTVSRARFIVLATLGLKAPFSVPVEFLHLFPQSRLVHWADGDDLPWLAPPKPLQPHQEMPPSTLILTRASGAELARLLMAAQREAEVAFLVVLPAEIQPRHIASLGSILSRRVDGTIVCGMAHNDSLGSLPALAGAGLRPLWQLEDGELVPCPDIEPASLTFRRSTTLPAVDPLTEVA